MRPGQRRGKALEFLVDGDRVLVTVRYAALLSGRALSTIRDRSAKVPPVACDVATGALYWDAEALDGELAPVARRIRRETPRPRKSSDPPKKVAQSA